ncbi:MAG: hypothetical protein MUP02_07980 [Actinobacteria bacterium]|nr:hypothetical protein [Actinomycetota bacterium]
MHIGAAGTGLFNMIAEKNMRREA